MKQSDIVKDIRVLGYKVTVLTAHASNRGGIFDTLISINGLAMLVEIKIDDDEPSKLQLNFMGEFYSSAFILHYDSKRKIYMPIWNSEAMPVLLDRFLEMRNRLNILALTKKPRKYAN